MGKRNKLWLSIQAVTLAGVATLGACSMESEGDAAREGEGDGATVDHPSATSMTNLIAQKEGDGEGGEGGEGDEDNGDAMNPAVNDLAYLTQLGLIRGRLLVAHRLYLEGRPEQAKLHMTDPDSELYEDLIPAFSARGGKGFSAALESMASKVDAQASPAEVTEAYQKLDQAISESEGLVAANSALPEARLKLAVALLREAGEDYAHGVVDGNLKSVDDYLDAFGFTQIAKSVVDSISSADPATHAALVKAGALVTELGALWPSLLPPATGNGDSSELYGAAARVELLALGLEQE